MNDECIHARPPLLSCVGDSPRLLSLTLEVRDDISWRDLRHSTSPSHLFSLSRYLTTVLPYPLMFGRYLVSNRIRVPSQVNFPILLSSRPTNLAYFAFL